MNHPLLRRIRQLDLALSRGLLLRSQSLLARRLVVLGAHLGDGWIWLAVIVLVLLVWPSQRTVALGMLLSLIPAAAITGGLKYALRRARPQEAAGFYHKRLDRYSFPSGHSARIACICIWLGLAIPTAVPALVLLACLVPTCRVALGLHYLSDILAGLILGAICSAIVAVFILA